MRTVRGAPQLVLASGSPRRRQLLSDAGYEFDVIIPTIGEVSEQWLTILEATTWNAMRKAAEVAKTMPDSVVVGADTLVTLDGRTIGKPANHEEAGRILQRLSGRVHQVWTSVYVCHLTTRRAHHFQEMSNVRFRELDKNAITKYLAKIDPLDKAGAYAAQGHGAEIIDRIEGSYTNVVGLPMEETTRVLRAFGVGVME